LLEKAFEDRAYYCGKAMPEAADERQSAIHAKHVLRDIFAELSETRVRYDEVEHGLALTEWMVGNEPGELREISELLTRLLVRD
jgi:hypothetical protein